MDFVFVIIRLDRTKSVNTAAPYLQRLSTVLLSSRQPVRHHEAENQRGSRERVQRLSS